MSSISESSQSAQLAAGAIQHLRAGGVSLLLDTRGPRLPRIVHWGSDLGQLGAELLDNLATADIQAAVTNVPDDPVRPGIPTEHATGWPGLPGPGGRGPPCSPSPTSRWRRAVTIETTKTTVVPNG